MGSHNILAASPYSETIIGANAVVTGGWTNSASATGIHDTVVATAAGSVQTLILSYADFLSSKIVLVKLNFYVSYVVGITGGSLVLSYSLNDGSSFTDITTLSATTNDLTAPFVFDLIASLGSVSSSQLSGLQTRLVFTPSTIGGSASVDAVELEAWT
jgi:hypothetical protein